MATLPVLPSALACVNQWIEAVFERYGWWVTNRDKFKLRNFCLFEDFEHNIKEVTLYFTNSSVWFFRETHTARGRRLEYFIRQEEEE